jgi:glycosyltransferase involved in cell wall biosynthesis
MRLLHIEAGRHLYGGARQVLHLMEGLSAIGHSNILVCPPGAEFVREARRHADVIEVPMHGDLDMALFARLNRVIRETSPSLIHAHSRRGADLYPGLSGRYLGIPVVLSRRVDNPEPTWLARFRAGLFDRVIVISEAIRDVQRSLGVPESKLICIRDAIDAKPFLMPINRIEWRVDNGVAQDSILLGMVAQFIPRKGHRVLLQSLESLFPRYPNLVVFLYGRGPLEEEIKTEVDRHAWGERVRFMGFVDPLSDHLGALDLLVHPASAEGLGVSLLQASAAGLPIVAFSAGGVPEAVISGATGILVNEGSSNGLTDAISTLLDDPPTRTRMGLAGRQRVLESFTVEQMVRAHVALYHSLLESSNAPS